MTASELLVEKTEENQTRKILKIIEEGIKNELSLEKVKNEVEALLYR